MFYELPKGHAGMLVLTHCDHVNNQFVDLAAWSFPTHAEFMAAWASVPKATEETGFLLDRHGPDGMDANKSVTIEWIEQRTGKSLADLLASGRGALDQWLVDAGLRKPGETVFKQTAGAP